jgi:DNA-binding NarL/FixJ family response regulator
MPSNIKPSPQSKKPVRLLIVDDMTQVREGLRRWLELVEGVLVIGEATNGKDALRQAEALRPDVVLMDLEMPLLDGWQATREIKMRQLAKRVVVLSIHVDPESTQRALQAGADAILPKGIGFDRLLQAIMDRTGMEDEEEQRR